MTDSEVSACLARVRQRDESAVHALIAYMYPLVYKIARSNVSRRGSEEDLVQIIMSRIFKNLGQFSGQVPFKHWVSRVAVNACLSAIRHEKRRPETRMADLSEEEEAVLENLAVADGQLDASLGLAARDLIQHLVACLKPQDRMLVRLVYLEGLGIEGASEATGWARSAIAMRLSRAKARMRERHAHLLKGGMH
jgi:RNA polymerase sigma-70 factor (ECF subfamily)